MVLNVNKQFTVEKHEYQIYTWSDKAFKGIYGVNNLKLRLQSL